MVTGLLGALIGAGASVGTGLFNAHHSASEARAADERQYLYTLETARNLPLAQRQGLEAAGYNPMLALGNIGGSSAMPSHQGTSNVSFDGSSARALGEFFEKLAKDKAKADVDNIKADTALKKGQLDAAESQRLMNEANTSLLMSQAERSDLAYGRDIVDTAASIAGTAGSLYSAKAMSDVAKQNASVNARNATVNERRLNQHKFEVVRDKNVKKVGSRESMRTSRGIPTVINSSKSSKPNVGVLGHSVKSVSNVAKDVAHSLMFLPFLAPLGAAAWGAAEGFSADDKSTYKRMEKAKEKSYWSHLRLR